MKRLVWLADTRSKVKSFPAVIQDGVGYALYLAQLGGISPSAKPLKAMEIRVNDSSGTYRAVYTVAVGEAVYILHAFQKKSKSGIATPKSDVDLIRRRVKQLLSEVKNEEKSS